MRLPLRGSPAPEPVEVSIPEPRRVGALADAFRGRLRNPLIVANGAAAVAAFGVVIVGGQPAVGAPLLLRLPIAMAVFALAVCALLPVLVRGRDRAALETFAWIGRWDWLRWRTATGERPPATPEAARAWLDRVGMERKAASREVPSAGRTRPGPANEIPSARLLRVEPLLLVGDVAAAGRAVDALPDVTPWQRFEKEILRAQVEHAGGGRVDPRPARAAASLLTDREERLRAETLLAVSTARVRLAGGGDWLEPLAAIRPSIGAAADGVLRHEFWPTLFRLEGLIALVCGVVLVVLVGLG